MIGSRLRKGLAVLALSLVAAVPAPPAAARNGVLHTQWLALRFFQDGMSAHHFMRGTRVTEVFLRAAPFTIALPRRGDGDLYRITAWTDESIFESAPIDRPLDDPANPGQPSYFSPGTGLADTEAGSGTLYLDNEGHNYLTGLRLGPDPQRHEVYYSSTFANRTATPMARMRGRLYLVASYDADHDDVMENGEYEFIILNFGR